MADLNVTNAQVLSGNYLAYGVYQSEGIGPVTATYSITGGADATAFSLVKVDGYAGMMLRFNQAPTLGQPHDAGRDNTYEVQVTSAGRNGEQTTLYRLSVVNDDYPATVEGAGTLSTNGEYVYGSVDLPSDKDWFRFDATGGNYLVAAFGDNSIGIRSASGQLLYSASLSGGGDRVTPQTVTLAAGTYYLEIGGQGGAYAASVAAAGPSLPFPSEGDDIRVGSAFADFVYGNGGNDTLSGQGGYDFIYGGLGNDALEGGAQKDYLRGDAGNDVIRGNGEFDNTHGNQGNDTIYGGDGGDWVVGGQDGDLLYGEAGADVVVGNLGADVMYGGFGDDRLHGGQGDDQVFGEDGDDFLSGDRGADTLSGGAGADTFYAFQGAGLDRITDFSFAEGDRVLLAVGTTYTIRQEGADVVIDLGGYGEQIFLAGVAQSSLGQGWIGFL